MSESKHKYCIPNTNIIKRHPAILDSHDYIIAAGQTIYDKTDLLTSEHKINIPFNFERLRKSVNKEIENNKIIIKSTPEKAKEFEKQYIWKRKDGDCLIDEKTYDEILGAPSLVSEREHDHTVKFWEEKITLYNRRTSMKYHDITIHKKNGGFLVNVGCEDFVFETEKKMFEAISLYFSNPEKAEEKYVEKSEG